MVAAADLFITAAQGVGGSLSPAGRGLGSSGVCIAHCSLSQFSNKNTQVYFARGSLGADPRLTPAVQSRVPVPVSVPKLAP